LDPDVLIFIGRKESNIQRSKKYPSSAFQPLKMRSLPCMETLGFDYPVTRCHMPLERNSQLYHCENLKIHKHMEVGINCRNVPSGSTMIWNHFCLYYFVTSKYFPVTNDSCFLTFSDHVEFVTYGVKVGKIFLRSSFPLYISFFYIPCLHQFILY